MELLTLRIFASLKWAGTVQLPKLIVSAPSWIIDSFVLGATFLLSSYFATTFGWWVEVVRDLQRKELVKRLTFVFERDRGENEAKENRVSTEFERCATVAGQIQATCIFNPMDCFIIIINLMQRVL